MEAFTNFWIHLYALTAFVPFLWFFIIWIIVYVTKKSSKQATKLAMDVTTFLLIGVVSYLYTKMFHNNFGFYMILLFFLIGYGLLGNFQYKLRGSIKHLKIIRILWRLAFLLLSAAYFIFLIVGLIQVIIDI